MSRALRNRWSIVLPGALLVVGAAAATDALAGRRRPRKRPRPPAVVLRVDVPLGLQGVAGAGRNVVIPFALYDPTGRATDIDAQFGIDRNMDGQVSDDEFRPATEDRLDPRNTRRNRTPQDYVTGSHPGVGAAHAFVWWTSQDVGHERYLTLVYARTDQGRLVPDPWNPGEFLFGDVPAGVAFRIRAAYMRGRTRVVGEWVSTPRNFAVDNDSAPSMRIDSVVPVAAGTGWAPTVEIVWTGFDPDSEDSNGNGEFDPGEDWNGNGILDEEQLGVAFDFCRLLPGQDPAAMNTAELESLLWEPCTRSTTDGDGDSFRAGPPAVGERGMRVYGTPGGRTWTFVWDAGADRGADGGPFIVRGTCIDPKLSRSATVVVRQPFTR